MRSERMAEPEAIEEWQADLDNPDVMKHGTGGSLEVAVRGIPVAVGLRGREISRAITHTGSLPSAEAGATAAKRMASLPHAGSLTNNELAGLGECFQTGAASRVTGISAPTVFPGNSAAAVAPPLAGVLPPTTWTGATATTAPTPLRKQGSLAARLSDPADPGQRRESPEGERSRLHARSAGST